MDIRLMGNALLRLALRQNLVSFPSQVPTLFGCSGHHTSERVAQLYFVRGWSVRNICDRYGLQKYVAHKLITEWRIRAIAAGYIQDIHPEALEALARAHYSQADEEEIPGASVWVSAPPAGYDHTASAARGF